MKVLRRKDYNWLVTNANSTNNRQIVVIMQQTAVQLALKVDIVLIIVTGCTGVQQDLEYMSSSHVYTANECGLDGQAVHETADTSEAKCKFDCLRRYAKGKFM